jgi:hypothetical protein
MVMTAVDDGFGNKVHGGFKSAWDDLQPVVDQELYRLFGGERFTNNVTFTGHSLGGAISQLATADYMRRQNGRLIDTVTFASPTVGDAGFNARIAEGHMMRVVDPRDSVPKVVQTLQPEFVVPETSTRVIALGDKDKRANDAVKRDAIRFGLELSFDLGIALLLAYMPEAEEVAEGVEGGVEGVEGVGSGEKGTIADLSEKALLAAEEAAGAGPLAEEEALAESFVESIGGGGDTISQQELGDIRNLFNPEFRSQLTAQLREMSASTLQENMVRIGESIDWEKTLQRAMVSEGISEAAQNLLVPFVTHNIEGDVDVEGVKFLLDNGFDYMYGAAKAHPVHTYINNVNNQFGGRFDNARADMWNNYQKNLRKEGRDTDELLEFMTEEELDQYMNEFAHEDSRTVSTPTDGELDEEEVGGEVEEEDDGVDTEEDGVDTEEDDEVEQPDAEVHNLAGIESNAINGRPLHVFVNRTGRKSDGSTIFSVQTERGEVLSYTGPSHAASSTTLYGKWTGIAPFANALPVKVSRNSGFGGQAFSALDTFSMAYLINSYADGYHNQESDDTYQRRIKAAIKNGYISDSIDSNELRVARLILREFQEKGHLFSAEDESITSKGNMLSELEVMTRGSLSEVTDKVRGIGVNFSRGEKRKLDRAFETREGQGVARELMDRGAKRIRASEVEGANVLENSMETLDFNMRVLRVLGLENSVEYSILNNGAKQAANAYMTALNVEEELVNVMSEKGVTGSGLFPNPMGSLVSYDQHRDEDLNMSGNEEYLKDRLTLEIVKSFL